MDLFKEMLEPLISYIGVTFLSTEVVKQLLRRMVGVDPARWTILVAIAIGCLLSYGWTLSVLPEPQRPGLEFVSVILTGLVIAGAATGVFSWVEEMVPWYRDFNEQGKRPYREV